MHVLRIARVAEAARVVQPFSEALAAVRAHQRQARAAVGGARGGRDRADLRPAVVGVELVLVGVVLVRGRGRVSFVSGSGSMSVSGLGLGLGVGVRVANPNPKPNPVDPRLLTWSLSDTSRETAPTSTE